MKMILRKFWNSMFDVSYVIMAMLVAYLVVVLLLFGLAFLLYKYRWEDSVVGLIIHGIHIFGGSISGLIISKLKSLRKYSDVSGWISVIVGICAGMIYTGILLLVSVILTGSTLYMKTEGVAMLLMGVCGCLLGTQVGYKKTSSQD